MENKSHALAAGLFVVAVTALLAVLALWLTRDIANTTTYEMTSSDAVTGLQVQAPVRFKGVAVGKVTDIAFDPAARGNVLVTVAVSPAAHITQSNFATLAFQGVTGLSFIQLDDDGASSAPPPAGPNGPPRIPLKPNALGQLTDQASALIDKVDKAVESINQALGPGNQAALTQALAQVGAAAGSMNQLALTTDKTLRTQFDPARTNLPALVQQAGATLKTTQDAAAEARRAIAALGEVAADAQQGLARVTGSGGVIDRMGESATTVTSTTLPRIQHLTDDASRTIRRLDRIADALGENPQALLYGSGAIPAGPGEPGFAAPAATSLRQD